MTQDGWYRFRIQAGAFAGEGKEAQKEVRLVVEYAQGSPLEVAQSKVIDAPLDAPKEYEFVMYLQFGPPGFNRSFRIGWDNGDQDVVKTNPLYWDVQWKPVTIAGQIERAIQEKKPAEFIAALRKQSDEALGKATENRKTFDGPNVDLGAKARHRQAAAPLDRHDGMGGAAGRVAAQGPHIALLRWRGAQRRPVPA